MNSKENDVTKYFLLSDDGNNKKLYDAALKIFPDTNNAYSLKQLHEQHVAMYFSGSISRVKLEKELEKEISEMVMCGLVGVIYPEADPECSEQEDDVVNDPRHYTQGIETSQYVDSWRLNFNQGNAIKYVTRCDYKGKALEDLSKALWYVAKEMENRGGHEFITKFAERWLKHKTMLTKVYSVKD